MAAGDSYFDTNDDMKRNLTSEQLLRCLTKEDSNGNPALNILGNITVSTEIPTESSVTTELIQSAGSQTLAALFAAYGTWKANSGNKRVVRETHIMGGDGIPGILISHKS